MTMFRVVCIGAGYFARFHVEAWMRMPEVDLVAICDHERAKAERLAAEFQVKNVFTTIEQVTESLSYDIIDIITPPKTHLSLCLYAAAHDKHIICQKPLAPGFMEAQELVSKMDASEVRFMVHENFRFQPWYRKIKNLLQEGIIGDKIFSINHRMRTGDGWSEGAYLERQPYFRQMPRLLIYETGIHFVDVFRFLQGEVRSVYARLRKLNPNIAGEDAGLVLFEFENGCQGILDANRYNEPRAENPRYTFGEMLIEGKKGTIRLEESGAIFLQKLGAQEIEIAYRHKDINFAGDCVFFTQQHFIHCLQSGEAFETNGPDYLNNLIIQEAIYESAQSHEEVTIEQ